MKQIKVLGSGCAKCKKLLEMTRQAADELGLPYELSKVEAISEIISYDVMMTPALVVDGKVRVAGHVPKLEEIKALIA